MKSFLGKWCCGVIVATLAAGCTRHGKEAPQGGSEVPPSKVKLGRNVELAYVEQRPIEYFVETVGYLEPEGQTEIAAGVTGVVDEVLFREGQFVDADTILVKVDQKRYLAAAEVARANEKRATENVKLKRDLYNRTVRAKAGTSEEEKEKGLNELNVAIAEIQSATATRNLADHNLERSQVRAPYSGQINQRRVTPGSYLEEKTVIANMADLSRMRLVGWIPEKAAPTVRELIARQEPLRAARLAGLFLTGDAAAALMGMVLDSRNELPTNSGLEFTVLPFPEQTFKSRIFYMSTVASPDTHMFECKGDVSTDGPGKGLRPGFTARIRCPLRSNPKGSVVPEESVRATERGNIAFVPVLQGDKWIAEERKVELGYRAPGWIEVLQGLTPGERIVRKGAEALTNGTLIQFPDE